MPLDAPVTMATLPASFPMTPVSIVIHLDIHLTSMSI
jgi:hypothetical protein